MTENQIGKIVVDVAFAIHKEIGPGLLESVYEAILAHELEARGLKVQRQVPISIRYHNFQFDEGFRIDLLVDEKVILELKSVESMNRVFAKQVLTYLRLSNRRLGYVINFGMSLMKNGIERVVNGLNE
ncbi:MAG: GxxExxY protein [Phycisphaerae bacterium]|nr:GxxExxY protein [Phycisphaerae bacterium]